MALPFPTFPIVAQRLVSEFRGDYNQMLDAVMKCFAGPDEPPFLAPGVLWLDTGANPKTLRQRNQANTGWTRLGLVDVDYGGALPLTGGVMSGQLDMNGHPLINLPAGSGNSPARYSDLVVYVKADGSVPFGGIPTLPGSDPSQANHATRKAYVDAKALAGGAYTGQITMATAPTVANHVARKTDLDGAISSHNHAGGAAGPKVLMTNLSSQGVAAGQVPEADGANGVQWTTRPRLVLLEEPILLVDDDTATSFIGSGTPQTWKSLDLSAHIPVGSSGAVLLINFGASSAGVTECLVSSRPGGSTKAITLCQYQPVKVGTGSDLALYSPTNPVERVLVAVSGSRVVELALRPNFGNSLGNFRMSLWVGGYF